MTDNLKDVFTRIALQALRDNKKEPLWEALDRGADPMALVEEAVKQREAGILKALLRKGATLSSVSFEEIKEAGNAFIEMALDQKLHVQQFLIESIDSKNAERFRMALDNGGDVRGRAGNPPEPLIHFAFKQENFDKTIAQLILLQGVDIDTQDSEGRTPLMNAFLVKNVGNSIHDRNGNMTIPSNIEFILAKSADPGAIDSQGQSVFDVVNDLKNISSSERDKLISKLLQSVKTAVKPSMPALEKQITLKKAMPPVKGLSFKPKDASF